VNKKNKSRPKVIIFRNELLPLSETFVLAQARALRTFDPVFAGVHPAPRSLMLNPDPVFVSSSHSLMGKVARRIFWRTSLAPRFFRQLRSVQPSLIHAHFALDGTAALPVRAALNIPLVVTLHGYDVSSSDESLCRSPEGKLYLRRRDELWEKATFFLCISDFIRRKALEKGFPREKLRCIYTGTDLGLFQFHSAPRDPNMILFVGRLVEKKGCNYLLDALAEVRKVRPAVRLVLIGAGPLEQALRRRAEAEKLPCEFLGMQSTQVVKEYMAGARVFCVPSITAANGDSEGLGMVFIEALAMGTPVASFDHGGIAEVVNHGKSGLLAPEGDHNTLAVNLLQLLSNDQLWKSLSDQGRRDVQNRFDIAKQTVQLEEIYLQAIASHA
jgi:colanic acid/amylovoran biosynthesis glycosyltransferase